MIIYFANRKMEILGQASSGLPNGLTVIDDVKVEEVETGVATFECVIPYTKETFAQVDECTAAGNYILRSHEGQNEFYTIIDREKNTKKQEMYLYAEDAGLDLLNEVIGAYTADQAYSAAYYIELFSRDSGFEIGTNEVASLTRKLSWDGESTKAERIASVATQFDGCEISYSFEIKGLEITHKYINIYKERGKDVGAVLRLNQDIDNIITTESIANLATALKCTGGTPEDAENPINLEGYVYDDGDFYVEGTYLKSRKAVERWTRHQWAKEPGQGTGTGHIERPFSYDTTSQKELCSHAVTELKKRCEIEVNYEVDIAKLPDDVKIGDRVTIIDDESALYVSARILKLETSVFDDEQKATLGEYLIKESGISEKVANLAAQFAAEAQVNAQARADALNAKKAAEEAKKAAEQATASVSDAIVSAKPQFYRSVSPDEPLDGDWSDEAYSWIDGLYIFSRTEYTYGDGTVQYLPDENGVCITGNTGAAGAKGDKGDTGEKGADGQMLYATCSTSASTTAKVATLSAGTLTLVTGVTVSVKFTYANTKSAPTLNIAGTGAKYIRLNGSNLTSSSYWWEAGAVITFVYGGGVWNITDASALKKAEAAAKTATNYLYFDSANGLLVGDKSSGSWSGYRAQVKSDSFNILDADGTELASYGANEIDLGKNNQDTVIRLCAGSGQISMDSDREFLRFYGDKLQMLSEETVDSSSDLTEYVSGVNVSRYGEGSERYASTFCFEQKILYDAVSSTAKGASVDVYSDHIALETYVDNYDPFSGVYLYSDHVDIETGGYAYVKAPYLTMDGDLAVTGDIEDKYSTIIRNGLAAYTGSGTAAIDPNTTLESLVLTNKNTPVSSTFMYIHTMFYNTKATSARRSQVAIPYNQSGSIYHRYYSGSSWSTWRRCVNDDELKSNYENLTTATSSSAGTVTTTGLCVTSSGRVVVVNGAVKTTSTGVVAFQLPFKPACNMSGAVQVDGAYASHFTLNTSGMFNFNISKANAYHRVCMTFIDVS